MVGRPSSEPELHRGHRLVEHYTPDGAIGRILLAIASGSLGVFSFGMTMAGLFSLGVLGVLILAPLFAALTLGSTVLTVALLWPVYLSLIGNVESARAYPESSSKVDDFGSSNENDPIEVLKRKYAAGKVSESEFERRLETLLGTEGSTSRSDGRSRELERN
jgi:uncharacterized membrane protein